MCAVSLFSGVIMYIYDCPQVPLFGRDTDNSYLAPLKLSHNAFILVYNTYTFLGDTVSRKIAYLDRPHSPFSYLVMTVIGVTMCLSKIAVLAPFGIFLIFAANGFIYGSTCRHIDMHVDKHYNLIALSFWLFVGDLGSVIGSNLISYVKVWIGPACPSECNFNNCIPDAFFLMCGKK